MAGEYKSAYTGEQIDAGIGKANTAVQPSTLETALEGKQNTLISGVNIKTINDESILGSGNIVIQGGGGSSDFNVKVIDATNPDDWDEDNDGPSQTAIEDIVENQYQAIRLINVPIDEQGSTYELDMFLTAMIDSDAEGYWAREYVKFDSGDEDEQDPPFMQCFEFGKQGEDPAEMHVSQYELGGGGSSDGGVFFTTAELGGADNDEISLPLYDLSVAIDNNQEVIVRINGSYGYKTRYFRISNIPDNKTYISGPDVDCWTPTFRCIDKENEYYMDFDRYESEAFIFKVYTGPQKFIPTAIDIANKTITLDTDDYSYIFNNRPEKITLNVDENSGETWVDFTKVAEDLTSGSEVFTYTSALIPLNGTNVKYNFVIYMNSGNVETEISAEYTPYFVANVTLAQDYSKIYFSEDDLDYLQHNEPAMIKCIWDDGEGHQGAFVLTLNTNQEGGTGNCPRNYSFCMVESGSFQAGTLKIDSGYTTITGCPLEMYSV